MRPLLDLTLMPNRSFARGHARALIAAVGGVFLLGGLRLLVLGAWPVIPFMLADVALLSWAFSASYRSGTAFETLRLTAETLTLRRVGPHGDERRVALDPWQVRARLERISDLENVLWLESRGTRVVVGAFLSPAEREAIHPVIAAGLTRFRTSQP